MITRLQLIVFCFVGSLALSTLSTKAHAEVPEELARQALAELHLLVTEGTGVIADLQPLINTAKVDSSQTTVESFEERLAARYRKAAGRAITDRATGLTGETRRAYLQAYRGVLSRYRGVINQGGQDAFVPAYFRALVLKEFNMAMNGTVRAVATNRDNELINGDSSVGRLMKGSPEASQVTRWMQTGSLEPLVQRSGGTLLGYWPMKLAPGCVACHAANGLQQKDGAFGGALVASVVVR